MKIALLRLSALGDVAQALLLVRCLQKHRPEAQISWIIGRNEARLLGDIPGVEWIIFDKKRGLKSYADLRQNLKNRHFDVLLNLHMSVRASLASLLVRAPLKVGYDRQRAHEGNALVSNRRIEYTAGQSVQASFLAFLKAVDVDCEIPTAGGWAFPVSTSARELALQLLPTGSRYFIVSPLSSHSARNWIPQRYAEVMNHVYSHHRMTPVLLGGPGSSDRAFADRIIAHLNQPCLDLTGKDSLATMAGLIQRADLFMAPDSGPLHIANALGVPLIGLYACTDPRRSGPQGQLAFCTNRFEEAAQQFLGQTAHTLKWRSKIEEPGVMSLIEVEEVINLIEKRLTDETA